MPACVNIMIQLNTGIPPSSSPHVIHVIVVPWVVMVYGIHVRTSESVYVFPRVKPEELHYTLGCSVAGSNYMTGFQDGGYTQLAQLQRDIFSGSKYHSLTSS